MVMVRTIAQRYWQLSHQNAQLLAARTASEMAEEILKREKESPKDSRDAMENVAEATRWVEQFHLVLVGKMSDWITSERQLREVLGLPLADDRRIVPISVAVDTKIETDWNSSLSTMLENQPDVVRAREIAKSIQDFGDAAERRYRNDTGDHGGASARPKNPASPESSALEKAIRQAMKALTRFSRDVDSGYIQYQTARKRRTLRRGDFSSAQGAYYQGRITLDQLFDSLSQYAYAMAQEAQSKANYNIAIVALEEAKGTLLDKDDITLVDAPAVGTVGAVGANPSTADESSRTPEPAGRPKPAEPRGRTMAFEATIRVGAIPIEIRGSVTVGPAAAVDSEGR
jgi:hypothetical protein